ncbi:MAG: Asp-tRNA(Asn)/Glu-tRNA(Gln) amidotransferase subunit GatC [Patescibacteria group bacterium]
MAEFEAQHLADLARLELTAEELTQMEPQLLSILDFIGKLQEVDTSSISPSVYINDLKNVFREDEAEASDADTRARLIAEFPDRVGDLLKVQGVFEQNDEAL